ncbi:transcription termination/antitermination NusG family protein [Pseudochrobactrum algeriensis]|uniref:transcription termination/antitermination NusG family protein n=1 Tax=Pseudochrobactrum TaxID=354349 RepID=UPI00095146FE|nr:MULTISPECIES: transcription termination/antitermination NusG family protein [Pseudochrobactrum]QVQ38214.1 transcription termination/antitermination NusG family protein [Pseudochrobactrum algeriensis]QVQ41440.1 transcription termination/antitermination NusG family protein [Pseudochrobactrum algeriensis]QVQ45362.1 transcription termination/antitermination NusG family protein [Pseudochrobactrum algeriensis]
MMMPNNRPFEEARILEIARQLDERDPDRIKIRMQEKFLAIAAGNEQSEKQWFVLKTANKQEKAVSKSVSNFGIETWLPMKSEARSVKYTRRSKKIEVPIFNGYLFVRVVPCVESWVGLSRVDGAISLIFGQNGAIIVNDKYMNDLRYLTEVGSFNDLKDFPRYKNGERVSFPVGSAGVFEGVIEGYVGTRAARVLAFIFGQQRTIEVPLANLIKSA